MACFSLNWPLGRLNLLSTMSGCLFKYPMFVFKWLPKKTCKSCCNVKYVVQFVHQPLPVILQPLRHNHAAMLAWSCCLSSIPTQCGPCQWGKRSCGAAYTGGFCCLPWIILPPTLHLLKQPGKPSLQRTLPMPYLPLSFWIMLINYIYILPKGL